MDKESANVFNDLVKEIGVANNESFKDMGNYYQYKVSVDGEHSKVGINAKNGYLYIDITTKQEQNIHDSVVKSESQKSYVITLPKNGLLEKIKSEYKDKMLYINIPKAVK